VVDDATGLAVPAQFRVLARWNAGLSVANAPIQWLLVAFPAEVPANGQRTYRLVTDGSAGANPSPAFSLSLTRKGSQVIVNTGAARFVIGQGAGSALFDEIRVPNGNILVSGGLSTGVADGVPTSHTGLRRVSIEHQGSLSAAVVVEGTYDIPHVGGGGLASRRRYVFTAGSPTVIVRHAIAWEGDRCGNGKVQCQGTPNAVRLTRLRDSLGLSLTPPWSVTASASRAMAAVEGDVSKGQEAYVRQLQRSTRSQPLSFEVSMPRAALVRGQKADGAVVSASGATGGVAIALDHMHRYEPQALRLLPDGNLAIDLVDGPAWLGMRQGLHATIAVAALSQNPTRRELDQFVWAPLNHPLRAWPSPEWFGASDAVDEFPVGDLPNDLKLYDALVPGVLNRTLSLVDSLGMAGIQTFGLYPRLWGNPVLTDEIHCGDSPDPTPGETWDDLYWCATWTDYHGTGATSVIWAMRSGAVQYLDELGYPAALRMLHTQIMQCAPSDDYFYCGQAPAGYGGYRDDFNSSHAYFDNLFLYYWLTGDYTVVETLKRGAAKMRNYLCVRRPVSRCSASDPPVDEYANLTGRVASQWARVFRFVGLASDDASYLDDYRANIGRAFTLYYLEAVRAGESYGFLSGTPVTAPGRSSSDQLWMTALYDANDFFRLQRDTDDDAVGVPPLNPSRVTQAIARSFGRFGPTVSGNGTPGGIWPNFFRFNWSGDRIGGKLNSITGSGIDCSLDGCLYEQNKPALSAILVRSGQQVRSASMTRIGRDLAVRGLRTAWNEGMPFPLGKEQGELLTRTHAAVARLAMPAISGESSTIPVRLGTGRGVLKRPND